MAVVGFILLAIIGLFFLINRAATMAGAFVGLFSVIGYSGIYDDIKKEVGFVFLKGFLMHGGLIWLCLGYLLFLLAVWLGSVGAVVGVVLFGLAYLIFDVDVLLKISAIGVFIASMFIVKRTLFALLIGTKGDDLFRFMNAIAIFFIVSPAVLLFLAFFIGHTVSGWAWTFVAVVFLPLSFSISFIADKR